jgi:hypothetical protein
MMTEEEHMDVVALARQGWTITEIAEVMGRHPVTEGKWLKNGGPPAKREVDPALLVIDERWADRITEILKANPNLLGTSVDRLLRAEGFDGSYPTLVRPPRGGPGRAPPPRPGGERADRDHPRSLPLVGPPSRRPRTPPAASWLPAAVVLGQTRGCGPVRIGHVSSALFDLPSASEGLALPEPARAVSTRRFLQADHHFNHGAQ